MSWATDGSDGKGLQHENVGLSFLISSFVVENEIRLIKVIMVCSPLQNLIEVFLLVLYWALFCLREVLGRIINKLK